MHLPDALPPVALPPEEEAKLPVNGLQVYSFIDSIYVYFNIGTILLYCRRKL
jgi:hypothetical protein